MSINRCKADRFAAQKSSAVSSDDRVVVSSTCDVMFISTSVTTKLIRNDGKISTTDGDKYTTDDALGQYEAKNRSTQSNKHKSWFFCVDKIQLHWLAKKRNVEPKTSEGFNHSCFSCFVSLSAGLRAFQFDSESLVSDELDEESELDSLNDELLATPATRTWPDSSTRKTREMETNYGSLR